MKDELWKKTAKWFMISLGMFISVMVIPSMPFMFLGGIYAGLIFICQLFTALTISVKSDIKPHIPYSITAVILAVLFSLLAALEIDASNSNSFLAAGAIVLVLFFVPFLLIMAAVVYIRGRKKENEEQYYE